MAVLVKMRPVRSSLVERSIKTLPMRDHSGIANLECLNLNIFVCVMDFCDNDYLCDLPVVGRTETTTRCLKIRLGLSSRKLK